MILNRGDAVAPGRRWIRMFPDYTRRTPLWENSTPEHNHGYTTESEDLGLSEQLTADLESWQEQWDLADGDLPPQVRAEWLERGRGIAHRLAHEIEDFADITYEADWYDK